MNPYTVFLALLLATTAYCYTLYWFDEPTRRPSLQYSLKAEDQDGRIYQGVVNTLSGELELQDENGADVVFNIGGTEAVRVHDGNVYEIRQWEQK